MAAVVGVMVVVGGRVLMVVVVGVWCGARCRVVSWGCLWCRGERYRCRRRAFAWPNLGGSQHVLVRLRAMWSVESCIPEP